MCLRVCSNTVLFVCIFQAIPMTPIRIKVDPSHDASKVKAEGPGLSRSGKTTYWVHSLLKTASFFIISNLYWKKKSSHLYFIDLAHQILFVFGKHGHCVLQAKEKKSIVRKTKFKSQNLRCSGHSIMGNLRVCDGTDKTESNTHLLVFKSMCWDLDWIFVGIIKSNSSCSGVVTAS